VSGRRASALVALVDEAAQGLWRARRMTVVSILQIAVSVFLVGVFFLTAENLRGVVETVKDETAITVFLKTAATEADKAEIERIARESRLVARVRRVSTAEAGARFATTWKSLARASSSLAASPFPETIELDLLPDATRSGALPGFLALVAARPGADDVQFDVEWIRRLRGAVALVAIWGGAVGFFLAVGSVFTIANVVRLTILLHREEIEILRLVGAPEFLIRGPFLLGGLAQGILGGCLAVGILFAAFRVILHHVAASHNVLVGVFVVRFLPPSTCALLVAGGLVAGLAGGVVAVRRKHLQG
jgi:cell division transport system permease protein